MEYSAGWERGYVISSIDVGDVQMQCLLSLQVPLYSGHSSERIGEREREHTVICNPFVKRRKDEEDDDEEDGIEEEEEDNDDNE